MNCVSKEIQKPVSLSVLQHIILLISVALFAGFSTITSNFIDIQLTLKLYYL